MAYYVGVDGCKGGWVAIKISEVGKDNEVRLFSDFCSLWDAYKEAELILVDIPIGLPDGIEGRLCDKKARIHLPKRKSSVFPVPCRAAVNIDDSEKASLVNEERTGKRLTLQSRGILSKIREVDRFLLSNDAKDNRRQVVREIHPEICFWAINGGEEMKHPKKKQAGSLERERVCRRFSVSNDILEKAQEIQKPPGIKPKKDDILDALIAALTALGGAEGLRTIPEAIKRDAKGLTMEMVYRL